MYADECELGGGLFSDYESRYGNLLYEGIFQSKSKAGRAVHHRACQVPAFVVDVLFFKVLRDAGK